MSISIGMPMRYVKFRGLFDYGELLLAIRHWFEEFDYRFEEPKHQWKVPPEGAEAEIKFKGERKINEYVKYYIEIFFRTFDMKEVEVVKDGQKMKLYDGKVIVELGGKLDLDWQNRFGGNKLLQGLQDFFHKFIIKQDIGQKWEDDLDMQIIDLTNRIKQVVGHEAV